MAEKTYTLTEIVTRLRKAEEEGVLRPHEIVGATVGLVVGLGYPITDEGYAQFDADMTAAGL